MMWRLRARLTKWLRHCLGCAGVIVLLIAALIAVITAIGWTAFGAAPEGERLQRMTRSPQWADGIFHNSEPLWNDWWTMIIEAFDASEHSSPSEQPPYQRIDPKRFATPPPSGLRVTWLGHSTVIIEIDGKRFITDPIYSEAISPVSFVGATRWYAPPIALHELPSFDAVMISHDHYDHLDHQTMVAMSHWDTTFIVPLGVGAHLAYWGVPEARIVELDWWDKHALGDLHVVSTPARHASGRYLLDDNRTLWAGYAFIGPEHRVYFSGDTGLFRGMTEIGERLGPFDITMIEVGAYDQAWPDWHIGPEQAIRGHQMVGGEVLLPIHWGLFDLAYHSWTEPIERVLAAAQIEGVVVVAPQAGESVEPALPPPIDKWWADVPWRTAADYPIQSTNVDLPAVGE